MSKTEIAILWPVSMVVLFITGFVWGEWQYKSPFPYTYTGVLPPGYRSPRWQPDTCIAWQDSHSDTIHLEFLHP